MTAIKDSLRQMLAALQDERQALAAIDVDTIMLCANQKSALVGRIATADMGELDDECRGMVEAAHRLNEVNRQTRNLLAANVSARLNMLTGRADIYRTGPANAYIGGRPG
jgi:hypothetical protein